MDSPPLENQPCPLQFYNFSQLDHKQHCPIYSNVMGNEERGISLEDIDGLESEFMALQHSVQNRINLLESELVVLDNWQVKREYRKPSFTQPPAKKIQKLDGDIKLKNKKHSKPSLESMGPGKELSQQDLSIHKVKGDAPDRFWASVEPYCVNITESDIQMLQDGIRSYEKREELYCIPPLGLHYSRHWALDDLHEEHSESLRLGQMADPLSLWDKPGEAQEKESFGTILKDAESLNQSKDNQKSQCGPLTERLLAAFLEDPVVGAKGPTKSHGPKVGLPPGAPDMETLEERIKRELITLGLFEPPEITEEIHTGGEGKEDEILTELERKQAELSAIMEYNCEQREILLSLAKAEMKRQEAREELKEVDDELAEWLKKTNANKQKRKALGRKERETIYKLLETKESLINRDR